MEQVLKWIHGYGENEKIADSDGGRFPRKCAPELAKIAQACCHRPYTTPVVTIL